MQRWFEDFLRRHWIPCSIASIFLVWFPEVISNLQGLWPSELLGQVIMQKVGGMSMSTFLPYWLTIPISFLSMGFIAYFKLAEFGYIKNGGVVQDKPPSPLNIEFPDEWSCSAFMSEPAKVGSPPVCRRIVWVDVRNDSDHAVKNVRAVIGSFRASNSSHSEDVQRIFANKTVPLRFQEDKTVWDFSPRMSARLYVISHVENFSPGFIRLEGIDREAHENQFRHSGYLWTFKVQVTANGFLPVQREFTAKVDHGGLEVEACD